MNQDIENKNCQEILRKNNLFPIKKLGKGGFGSVYLVSRLNIKGNQNELLSVKCTNKKNFIKKPMLRRYLKQEIDIQSNINHINVVRLIRTFDDDGWNFMIMEYCDVGNLYNVQAQKPKKLFELNESKKYMNDILDGLAHLHLHNIIHRDLKPQNILLCKDNSSQEVRAKICDFGFAKQTQQQSSTFCGTTYFMAPEIFAKKNYENSVDVWAAGVIFYYMLYGTYPFKSMNMSAEIQAKCKHGFDLEQAKGIQNDTVSKQQKKRLGKLFQKIFRLNPSQRISVSQFKKQIKIEQKNKCKSEQDQANISTDEQQQQYISQKIVFIQKTYQQVKSLGILTNFQELAFKYYLDKYCLTLLLLNEKLCYPESTMAKLKFQLATNQDRDALILSSVLNRIEISRFSEVFTTIRSHDFNSYKQAYRIVLSHIFSKANRMIDEPGLRSQIKLKIFCCHSINRVFDEQYIQQVFTHFFNNHSNNHLGNRKIRKTQFKISEISKWIEAESQQKINDTVRILCDKFYRKSK